MINDFEDFCIWMYSVISDVYATVKAQDHRPGPELSLFAVRAGSVLRQVG